MRDLFLDWCEAEVEERRDGTITVDSIFRFTGQKELFAFLGICRHHNVDVVFEHEGIAIHPKDSEEMNDLRLIFYAWLATDPKEVKEYNDYNENIRKDQSKIFR